MPSICLGLIGPMLMKSDLNGYMWLVVPVSKQKGTSIDDIVVISSMMIPRVVFWFHAMETFSFIGSWWCMTYSHPLGKLIMEGSEHQLV